MVADESNGAPEIVDEEMNMVPRKNYNSVKLRRDDERRRALYMLFSGLFIGLIVGGAFMAVVDRRAYELNGWLRYEPYGPTYDPAIFRASAEVVDRATSFDLPKTGGGDPTADIFGTYTLRFGTYQDPRNCPPTVSNKTITCTTLDFPSDANKRMATLKWQSPSCQSGHVAHYDTATRLNATDGFDALDRPVHFDYVLDMVYTRPDQLAFDDLMVNLMAMRQSSLSVKEEVKTLYFAPGRHVYCRIVFQI